MLGKILCFLGFHSWMDADFLRIKKSIYPLRACTRCKKLQEGCYNMAYGGTDWHDICIANKET